MSQKNVRFSSFGMTEAYASKKEAIEQITTLINENIENYIDGEQISFVYLRKGIETTSNAIIDIKPSGIAELTVLLNEDETKKIVESDEEPEDKDVLWLQEYEGECSDLESDVKALSSMMKTLIAIVNRHEYAFTEVMDVGDITNSARREKMDAAEPEAPSGYEDKYSEDTGLTSGDTNDYEEEPDYSNYREPNLKHITIKSAETYQQILDNANNLVNYEMVFCVEDYCLYIRCNGQIIRISGAGEGGGVTIPTGNTSGITSGNTSSDTSGDTIIDIIMSIITTKENGNLETINFEAPSGVMYKVGINEDGDLVSSPTIGGKFATTPKDLDAEWVKESLYLEKLYINSVYCGGENSNEHSYNYCSHNFVELSNVTDKDINLNGLSLCYSDDLGETWEILPLYGIIKKYSTLLIRGNQCSVINADTTKIVVDTYDIEWPISFNDKQSTFYLCWGVDNATALKLTKENKTTEGQYKCKVTNNLYEVVYNSEPSYTDKEKSLNVRPGYIDLVTLLSSDNIANGTGVSEYKPFKLLSNKCIFTKYFNMEYTNQGNKTLFKDKVIARKNENDWYVVDLSVENGTYIPDYNLYKPCSSKENKNVYFNKTKMLEGKPSTITCTFGIEATASETSGATRCFNWVSKGYRDEFIWIKKNGDSGWTQYESIKDEPLEKENLINPRYYYNRIRVETETGESFTVHKQVIKNLRVGTYSYVAGTPLKGTNEPNMDACTDIRTFTIKTTKECNEFTFIQTSDQQGFIWDEYQVWKYVSQIIDTETYDWLLNTGDMTQTGSRIHEWLDYFNGKTKEMNNKEEMATVGNNDESPKESYTPNGGSDSEKINPFTINNFFTFELPEITSTDDYKYLPILKIKEGLNVYVPSLYSFNYGNVHFMCVNSEIKLSSSSVFGCGSSDIYNLHDSMQEWCKADFEKYNGIDSNIKWNILYCHEMPFHIITNKQRDKQIINNNVIDAKGDGRSSITNGCHANFIASEPYWLSEFIQNKGIRLVLGGHKHTQSTSFPLKECIEYYSKDQNGEYKLHKTTKAFVLKNDITNDENFESETYKVSQDKYEGSERRVQAYYPIIQVTKNDLIRFFGVNSGVTSDELLKTIKDGDDERYGKSYPCSWFNEKTGEFLTDKIGYNGNKPSEDSRLCSFELVSKETDLTAPVYAMSQATSYKLNSNKELPATSIPWDKYYFPSQKNKLGAGADETVDKPNKAQRQPMYTVWTIKDNEIIGKVKRVEGIMGESATFKVYTEGEIINSVLQKENVKTITELIEKGCTVTCNNGQYLHTINGASPNIIGLKDEKWDIDNCIHIVKE